MTAAISQRKTWKEIWPSSPRSRPRRPRRSASKICRWGTLDLPPPRRSANNLEETTPTDRKRERLTPSSQGRRVRYRCWKCETDRTANPESAHAISRKVAGLIKGLLAAKIIRPSTSPWASPIVIGQKSNGVDIRLCIDYKLPHEADGLPYTPDQ
ncbi:LOW QUALITY PROTEIN: reverse transcriptase [Phytophthora megakarya]|uniref:Reverse transcriptase n=1 Tax=Phytophthora megakarya TaxID=4795 RepID=A0A225UHA0_9STRA|nr:LOW QUALITY PROTEIN: reverse transcriptase [Phytophthora megakarya]